MDDLKKTLSDIAFELASVSKFHRVEDNIDMFLKNLSDDESYLLITICTRNEKGKIEVDVEHETASIRFDMDDKDVVRLKNILEENLEVEKC